MMSTKPHTFKERFVAYRGIIIGAVLFISGIFIGNWVHSNDINFIKNNSSDMDVNELGDTFPHINPLLFCADASINNLSNKEVANLENQIQSYINQAEQKNIATEVSVYYRDLNNGPWISINGSSPFKPGSLLKVPIAITAFKYAESHPGFLTQKITYTAGDKNASQVYQPQKFAENNTNYSVEELIELALIYSDNNATTQLTSMLDEKYMEEIYKQLSIELVNAGNSLALSVRGYASFFRVLYNSTYLPHEASEKVLSILAQSNFKDGLAAGVPATIEIAHKFGERHLENGIAQLHDCGIVYAKDKPYILCVMTRGKEISELAHVIKDISSLTYKHVENSNK